ncbi:MAG: DUF2185 domain-containing protein [Myxococcota bacterium]
MPRLSCFFAIYTDGSAPADAFRAPANTDVFLGEMATLVLPGPDDELFGPHATLLPRFTPRRGFLLGLSREVKGQAGTFFSDARRVFIDATHGLNGFGLDVLRLWPFPLANAEEALPDDPLAEDLFSVGFTEMGEHGFRAETFGFAKLGQRELSFEFQGRALLEEAALMCGHLADWLLEHGKRVEHAQSMAYGFDRLSFFAAEGEAGGPFRGWHPPIIQKLLPASIFEGVGVLEVRAIPEGSPDERHDLTLPLTRSMEQRLLLEELDLTGDSPHAGATAQVKGFISELKSLVALREEPHASKDSGWRFTSTVEGDSGESGVATLATVVRRAPEILRYLALPHGTRLEWDADGALTMDLSKARHEDDELDEALDDDELV